MRVLVLTTSEHYTPAVRVLVALTAGLSARGDTTAVACLHEGDVEQAIERDWPRLSHRAVVGASFARQAASLRGIVSALRPDAMLVGSATDASMAVAALGGRAGVLRRLSVSESVAAARGLEGDPAARERASRTGTRYEAWGTHGLVIGWPPLDETNAFDAARTALPFAPPHLVLAPAVTPDAATTTALRAAAHLARRVPGFRLTLAGDERALQSARVHAAALDLTAVTRVVSTDALLLHTPLEAVAVWVTALDDTGAVSTLAAMQQGLPVLAPRGAPYATMIEPSICGTLVADGADASAAAEVATWLDDHDRFRRLSEAAALRARQHYDWNAFVDEAAGHLARVRGGA